MTEVAAPSTSAVVASAGAMLRAARERQGMHLGALAAAMKVAPRKLEALEADRYDELPDLTFARALAQSMCRALKIDAAPVLAMLPKPAGRNERLEQVATGLNAPFRERAGVDDGVDWSLINRPAFWAPAIVLLGALALYLLPSDLLEPTATEGGDVTVTVIPSGQEVASAPATAPAVEASVVAPIPGASSALPAAPAAAEAVLPAVPVAAAPGASAGPSANEAASVAPLELRASQSSWVTVRDAQGAVLLSRELRPGESARVEGAPPLTAVIGNAAGTQVSFRGSPVDLGSATRGNVARLELK